MFPIRDKVRSNRFPAMTLLIIVINVLGFLHELRLPESRFESFMSLYGVVPAWAQAAVQGEPAQGLVFLGSLFSSMFLHGGWLHLISNMWFLWIFGDNVEDRMGRFRFLLFYLICGIAAAAAHTAFNFSSQMPTVGASGAIAGVLGAYVILHPRARIVTLIPIFFIPRFVDMPAMVFLGVWFMIQLLSQIMESTAGQAVESVAWMAHIGGFVAGMILVNLIGSRRGYVTPSGAR